MYLKTMTERVAFAIIPKRIGGGGSPMERASSEDHSRVEDRTYFLPVGSFASRALKWGADDGLLANGGYYGSSTLSSYAKDGSVIF